ncbi:MAG: hypothetical protein ACREOR_06030 [Candidatus Binatia bacterium]
MKREAVVKVAKKKGQSMITTFGRIVARKGVKQPIAKDGAENVTRFNGINGARTFLSA